MVTIWQDKIIQLKIRDTGALLSSFTTSVISQSGGSVDKIIFAYLYYGRMVDMGVRKGLSLNDQMYEGKSKKQKGWYNKPYYHSIKVLNEKRAELYGEEFQAIIMDTLNF